MALALTVNRHMHKAYVKVRENDFSLNSLMGFNFYQKTAGLQHIIISETSSETNKMLILS